MGITGEDREANVEFLRQGVVGVECIFVGKWADALALGLPDAQPTLITLSQRCCIDEYIGTVELYANGAINAFLRQDLKPVPTGMFRCR